MLNRINSLMSRIGFTVARTKSLNERLPVEATVRDRAIIEFVRPYTMTSSERIWSLLQAVRHVEGAAIPGAFVECGVWRGGSVMAMATALMDLGTPTRELWLYDTFAGMTEPSSYDVEASTGLDARSLLDSTEVGDGNNVWCAAGLQDVLANVQRTGYPEALVRVVKGDVSLTLAETVPDAIALLRLDTDWYESTRAELEALYPRLAVGGVCILDDYGHWAGARRAVDEYFAASQYSPLIHPVDFSGRIFVKTQ